MTKKGFTLIELLVVIAIVAVLSVVVILTLNPAELLRQARDANRVSDMSTLKSAISLYLADVATPNLGAAGTCYESTSAASSSAGCGGLFNGTVYTTVVATTSRKVDGTGWIPVNFTGISSGAPIGNLPVDPVNDATHFYAYAASSTTFEINSKMESSRYVAGGTGDVEGPDGGDKANYYEVGNAPGLSL
jgi:prepilin-type N-terminal cleavage/methylation domain-containing protein